MRPSSWPRNGRFLVAGIAVIAALAALWLFALVQRGADAGSLDARVSAVGATVRCPICPEAIPLNDQENVKADHMRAFIRQELQRGVSEDGVRQELVRVYGSDILLAPPQQGFDALIWLVPLGVLAGCAVAVLVVVRRWSAGGAETALFASADVPERTNGEWRRYEDMLERELAARE